MSYSRPVFDYQDRVLETVVEHLTELPMVEPVLLGIDQDQAGDPLRAIVDTIGTSSALLALAFRRNLIEEGTQRIVTPDGESRLRQLRSEWLTSSYCHIEVALAYQLNLPILVLQESGVVDEGVLDRNSLADSIVEFRAQNEEGLLGATELERLRRLVDAFATAVTPTVERS